MRRQDALHRLDAPHVLVERRAADLHLHHRVAGIEMALHLVLQFGDALARRVPAAADIDEAFVEHLAAVSARRAAHAAACPAILATASHTATSIVPMPIERSECPPDFSLRIITARILSGSRLSPRLVEQRLRLGLQDARDEARAHLRAAGIAAGGVERVADDRLAVAHHVGDHRDHRGGHLGEVDRGVLQRGVQRDGGFADVGDAHAVIPGPALRKPGIHNHGRAELALSSFLDAWLWIPGSRCARPGMTYSILSFASRTTLPHFSISTLMRLPNSSGVFATGTKPSVASFSFTSGCATALAISCCSRSTISFGVPAGTTSPVSVSES